MLSCWCTTSIWRSGESSFTAKRRQMNSGCATRFRQNSSLHPHCISVRHCVYYGLCQCVLIVAWFCFSLSMWNLFTSTFSYSMLQCIHCICIYISASHFNFHFWPAARMCHAAIQSKNIYKALACTAWSHGKQRHSRHLPHILQEEAVSVKAYLLVFVDILMCLLNCIC